MLSNDLNYIVSGLERSGTSVMMRMLHMGGLPMAFDDSRPPDEHNPKGYFELAGGKIINQLMDGTFSFDAHRGRIVKVTAYGLKFLPQGNYKIVYMIRNLDEVLRSMSKMGATIDMENDKTLFGKLHRFSLDLMERREDIQHITVTYGDVIADAPKELEKVKAFLDAPLDVENAAKAVDRNLYRNRARK